MKTAVLVAAYRLAHMEANAMRAIDEAYTIADRDAAIARFERIRNAVAKLYHKIEDFITQHS